MILPAGRSIVRFFVTRYSARMHAPQAGFVSTPEECFAANLAALQSVAPGLAETLAAQPVPPTAQPTRGRDGTPTYLLTEPDGQRAWFGGTSMPTISAPAILERSEVGRESTMLPRIGSGMEARLLLERIEPHCAVFVYEPDPVQLVLGLRLHDLAGPLRDGRLILLGGPDLTGALLDFFEQHPAYEFPTRIVRPPEFSWGRVHTVRAELESAGRTVAGRQAARTLAIAERLGGRPASVSSAAPRVAIVTVDPRPAACDDVRRLAATAEDLGWPAATCAPDHPGRCHIVARLETIEQHRANLVLCCHTFGGRIEPFLPESLRTVTWFGPTVRLSAALAEGVPKRGLHLVATPYQAQVLREAGLPAERVDVLEVGVDALAVAPAVADQSAAGPFVCDVAILCDVADLRAASHVSAESQQRLFEAILHAAPNWAETYVPDHAEGILTAAQQRSDRFLKDDRIRAGFIGLIRDAIAPSVLARLAVERLVRQGRTVRVWGDGWNMAKPLARLHAGPIPPVEDRNRIYHAARTVLCPFFGALTARTVLEAIVAGGGVLFRQSDVPLPERHPQLADVLGAVPTYRRLSELPRAVTRLLRPPEPATAEARAALRSKVLAEHTLAHRLRTLHARAQAAQR